MKKNINQILDNKNNIIFLLIGLSFLVRLIVLYYFDDHKINHEYHFGITHEWGILLNNLIKYNSLSRYGDQGLVPSVMLPPLYVYFLYFIKLLTPEKINFVNSLIFIQIILSTISVYVFYKINRKFFSQNISLINSIVFSLFPLNIYAAGQSSSITLQIFLSLIFLLIIFNLKEKQTKNIFFIFSLISGLLILVRAEFILIYILTILYFLFKKKVRLGYLLISIFLTVLVVSPYLIRNYVNFKQIVLVKSLGYNLWKGNNQFSTVEGFQGIDHPNFSDLKYKLDNIKLDTFYEFKRDDVYLNAAIENIKQDPTNYLYLFIKKGLSFYFVNLKSSYPNYYNFFHFFPVVIVAAFSFVGLIMVLLKNDFIINYLKIYLFSNIIIFSFFSILPRYKLMILPIQIILAAYFIEYLYKKIKKNEV